MTEAKIKSEFDSDLPYRKQTVKANNKTLVTPTKSFDPKHIANSVSLSKDVIFLNEMYSGVTSLKIQNHLLGKDKSLTYLLNSSNSSFRNPDEEMQLFFWEFKDEQFPTIKEIECMTDQAYVY